MAQVPGPDGPHPHLHPTLQRFSITSNGNLGAGGTADVAQALRTCTAITDLDLGRNDMCIQGVRTLGSVLASFSHLRRLTLAKNALGDKVLLLLLCLLLLNPCPYLPTSNLSIPQVVEAVAELDLCSALDTLDLSGNFMQAGGAIALAAHITSFSQLTHLDVGHNRMQNLGTDHLAHALAHLCIHHLDFGDNGCVLCAAACICSVLLRACAR